MMKLYRGNETISTFVDSQIQLMHSKYTQFFFFRSTIYFFNFPNMWPLQIKFVENVMWQKSEMMRSNEMIQWI